MAAARRGCAQEAGTSSGDNIRAGRDKARRRCPPRAADERRGDGVPEASDRAATEML